MLAERVVPDNPVAEVQADFVADDSDVGGVIVADGDIERAGWFENFFAGGHPFFCPGDVFFLFEVVVVSVVFVADIERRVSENQIRERFINLTQNLNAVAADNFV